MYWSVLFSVPIHPVLYSAVTVIYGVPATFNTTVFHLLGRAICATSLIRINMQTLRMGTLRRSLPAPDSHGHQSQ